MSDKNFGIINNCKRKAIITQWKTLGQYIQDVGTGGENKDLILELRKLDKKTQRAEYDKIKYKLPLTTAPNFKDNHCKNENFLGNDRMPLDVDNLTNEEVLIIKSKVCKLPFVECCYVSCGGHGLRIIIRTPFMSNDAVYKRVFALVEKDLALLGVPIDTACKDARRLSFDSYDPDIYYNQDATAYDVPKEILLGAEKIITPVKSTNTSQSERIYKFIDSTPGAVTGQGGSNRTFSVARALLEGFACSIPEATPYLNYYNQKCSPKWTEKELIKKLNDAEKKVDPSKVGSLNRSIVPYTPQGAVSEKDTTAQAAQIVDEWTEPEDILADLKLLPVLPFDTALLPNVFTKMVEDTAHRMQVPPEFIAVPMTVALSSLIAYRVDIRPKQQDTWTVVVNTWGVIIGDPSLLKTPCVQEAMKPVKRLEALAVDKYQKQLEEYAVNQKINSSYGNVIKKQAEGILKGTKEGNKNNSVNQRKQKARLLYEEAAEDELSVPIKKRYILGDSTTEKRQEIQAENKDRGLLIFRDELAGLIYKLDTPGKENDRAYYTESWTGDSNFTNDTIGRGTIEVPNNTLSILGTSQPSPWRNILADTVNSTHKDDGFPQRFQLAVYPDIPIDWKIIDRKPNYEARQQVYDVFDYLDNLDPTAIGAKEADGQFYLNFTLDAQEIFNKWWTDHENWLRNDDDLPSYLISHFSKYRSLLPSIALILHLSNKNIGDVDIESVEKAIQWIEYLKSHTFRLYGTVSPIEEQTARLIAAKLLKKVFKDSFTVRELYLKHWAGINKETAEPGLEVLQDAGWGRIENKSQGNKPSLCFIINPKIYLYICKGARHNRHNRANIQKNSPIEPIDTAPLRNIQNISSSENNLPDPLDMSFLDAEVGA